MVKIVQAEPEELEARQAFSGRNVMRFPDTLVDREANPSGPDFIETFAATWQRENLTFEALRAASRTLEIPDTGDALFGDADFMPDHDEFKPVETDPSWNPYAYIKNNWHPDRLKDLEFEIRRGMFEDAMTAEDLERRARELAREKRLMDTMSSGPFFGVLLGSLAAMTTDLSTYIPFAGPIKRLGFAGRTLKGLLLGTTAAAIPEVGLHQFQELRTLEESFLNIGTAGVLGAGLGALSHVIHPGHVLNPSHPDNPLKVENSGKQGVGLRTPEGDIEIIEYRDAGAAAVPADAPRALEGVTDRLPGLNKLTDKITGVTPAGRALRYAGDRSRELLVRMMDLGGILTDTNRFGVKSAHSAEDLKRDLLVLRDRLFVFGERQLIELNQELGQGKASRSAGLRGRIDEVRFAEIARRKLLQEWTDDDARALAREFGDDVAEKIEGRAEAFAERIHETNAEFERELIELGLLAPGKAMGRDYGHAQLWDPHSVMARQEEFEDFLVDVFVDSPDAEWLAGRFELDEDTFAKLGQEDVTVSGRTLSPEEGSQLRQEVLREWSGDEHAFNVSRAELREASTAEALKQAELDLTDTMRAYNFVRAETHRLEVSEARRFRDKVHAELQAARARRAELKAERQALFTAAQAARTRTLARQEQLLDGTIGDLKPGRTARKEPDPARTLDLAEIETRARKAGQDLVTAERQVRKLETKLARVDASHKIAAEKLEMFKKAKAGIRDSLADARKARKAVTKEAGKAKRTLTKLEKRTPLAQAVEDIHHALINRNEMPHSIMDTVIPETGRIKARRIRLTPEQRRRAEELGFLRTDLSSILTSQYEQLAGHIGLHKALDIRSGGRFGSWTNVLREIDDEYRALIAAQSSDKAKSRLNAERDRVKKDINLLKDRILGMENVGADRDGWAYWMSQKARQANFIRWGAGFLPPSLVDIASVHLRTGSLAKLLKSHGRETVRIMQQMDETELRAMVNATELGASGVRMAQALSAEDTLNVMGVGARGTFKHTFTSRVDKGSRWLSDKTNIVSGMRTWNRFWKITAGIYRAYRLRDMTARYGSLSEREVAELASLGIDRDSAGRIRSMIEKHGRTDANGHWDPNLDAWLDTPGGRETAREFRIAVERDMNRAVFTPGIGDIPGIMDHAAGKLWLQFMTYSFAFMNRFLAPASQRIATWRDAQAIVSFAHLAWTGLVVVLAKDIQAGRDPMERFEEDEWANTAKEVIDRSGLLAYFSPYVDSLLKVSAPLQEAAFGNVKVGPTSRYVRNAWMESAFGASYGLFRDIQSFGAAASEIDTERMTKKGLVLMPFNFYFRLMHQLADPNQR